MALNELMMEDQLIWPKSSCLEAPYGWDSAAKPCAKRAFWSAAMI